MNNEVLNCINTRRSRRAFLDKPIEKEKIEAIVEAGRNAPNAWGKQDEEFFIIRNQQILDEMAKLTHRHLGGKVSDHRFFNANTVIMLVAPRLNEERRADAGCAMENMMLAAHSLGLGSVWIDQFMPLASMPDLIAYLEKTFGVDVKKTITVVGAFGYPDENEVLEEKVLTSKVTYID